MEKRRQLSADTLATASAAARADEQREPVRCSVAAWQFQIAKMPCRGRTKQGLPCSIVWELDDQGFCKYHAPDATRCRGIARSTGRRCNIRWDLDDFGYCRFHTSQNRQQKVRQCLGVALTSGKRCQHTIGIDKDGYCPTHALADSSSSNLCQGVLLNSNVRCANDAKPGYAYCCAAHDPSKKYFAPSLFGDSRLRSNVEGDVVERYSRRDLYHRDALDLSTPGSLELDHIVEKQCFSYAFQFVEFRDEQEDVNFFASMLREEIVNELPNLCLTRTTTNRIKGAAVWHYLDDCLTGHVGYRGAATFNDYMLAENRDSIRLGRATTRIITSEMGKALKFCQRELAAQGETPQLEALSAQLQRLYVQMQLHTPHSQESSSRKTKPKEPSTRNPPKSSAEKTTPKDIQRKSDEVAGSPSSCRVLKKEKSKLVPTLNASAKPFAPHMSRKLHNDVKEADPSALDHSSLSSNVEKDVKDDESNSSKIQKSDKENSENPASNDEDSDAAKTNVSEDRREDKSAATDHKSVEKLTSSPSIELP